MCKRTAQLAMCNWDKTVPLHNLVCAANLQVEASLEMVLVALSPQTPKESTTI